MREFFKKTWDWLKKQVKKLLVILGLVAVAFAADDATTNEITPEKVATKYDQAEQIKSVYSLNGTELTKTDIKNQELDKYQGEPKDEVKVVIGDNTPVVKDGIFGGESTTTEFTPSIELKRWNEVSFKLKPKGLDKVATKDKDLKFDKDKILFSTPKISFEMYDYAEGEGGYKYIWYLNEKPASNIVEFEIESSGLDFFYQPPLTQEYQNGYSEEFKREIVVTETQVKDLDGNVLVERPENVVGSYAVYHSTKGGMNDAYGKEYKTGQAFFIYRPHIIDAEGKETWGILKIENGIYSVEIPQEFLDKASFPIKSNDDFGYTTAGGSVIATQYTDDEWRARVGTPAGNGTAISISYYGARTALTPADLPFKGALYQGTALQSPQTAVGSNNSVTHQWWTVNFSGGPAVSNTSFYVCVFWDSSLISSAANAGEYNYNTGGVSGDSKYDWTGETYPNFQDPLGGSNSTNIYSIYATYTPVAAGGSPYINRSQVIDEQ